MKLHRKQRWHDMGQNGEIIEYERNVYKVPISCFGLMNVPVNAIKDWYEVSPYFEQCRDLRAALQIDDEVQVFLFDKDWMKGTIIDIIIINSKEQKEESKDQCNWIFTNCYE
eukprot:296622_1